MDLSAQDIHRKQFHDAWRGYNQEEVDDFLDRVAETLERVQQEVLALRRRLGELEQQVTASREAEEMLKKTLVGAQKAAEEAIAKAKAKAEHLVASAEERARREREEARERAAAAEAELQRKTSEADRAYASRKRELDLVIERLKIYEGELKHRLKAFLEHQLRTLESLTEPGSGQAVAPPPEQPPARAVVETRPPQPVRPGPGVVRVDDRADAAEPSDQEGAASGPPRRGVRGLFWREEG